VHHRGFRPGGPVGGMCLSDNDVGCCCSGCLLRFSAQSSLTRQALFRRGLRIRPSVPLLRYVSLHEFPINVLNYLVVNPAKH